MLRRRVCAAIASAPYSMKLPASHRCGDVLAGGAAAGRMAPGHGLGPVGVQGEGVAIDHALQVGADGVVVGRGALRVGGGRRFALGRLQHQQHLAVAQRIARAHPDLDHAARALGVQHVLHLHRFEHRDLRARRAPSRLPARRAAPAAPASARAPRHGRAPGSRPAMRIRLAGSHALGWRGAAKAAASSSNAGQLRLSRKRVWTCWRRTPAAPPAPAAARRLVAGPSIRHSASARRDRRTASANTGLRECTISLASRVS